MREGSNREDARIYAGSLSASLKPQPIETDRVTLKNNQKAVKGSEQEHCAHGCIYDHLVRPLQANSKEEHSYRATQKDSRVGIEELK